MTTPKTQHISFGYAGQDKRVQTSKPGLETLRSLIEKHPEWADLPIGVLKSNGEVDYVDWSGSVFVSDPDIDHTDVTGSKTVLLFSGN
jgi:hypothetical protein